MSVLEDAFYGAGWDPAEHPRFEAGRREGGRFRPTVEWLDTDVSKLGHENMKNRVPWIYDPDLKKLFVGSPASDHSELSKKIYEVYGYDNALSHEWVGVWVPGKGAVLHGNETGDLPGPETPADPDLPRVIKKAFNEKLREYDTEEMDVGGYASAFAPLSAAGWDESQHPRNPSGTPVGGQFARLYHVSPVGNRQSIREKGLLPDAEKRYTDSGEGVYTFGSRAEAYRFATTGERMYGDSDIWEVKNEGLALEPDPFFEPGHPLSERAIAQMGEKPAAFVTRQAIPPESLTLHPNPWHPDPETQHRLVSEALQSWVSDPATMRIHMANELNEEDPGAGPGAQMREQAAALIQEVREGGANDKTLYRGATSLENDLGVPESWTENRAVARKFAGKHGQVFKLAPGEARGIRMRDYISSGMDVNSERQWLIDPWSRTLSAAGWREEDHPRDPGGEGGGQFVRKGTVAADEIDPKMGVPAGWDPVVAASWDPAQHPHVPGGSPEGGQWASKTTAEAFAPEVGHLRQLRDEIAEWNPARGTPQEAAARAMAMSSKEYLQDKRAWDYASAALSANSRYGATGQGQPYPETRILTVRKDGKLIGVGDMSWDPDEQEPDVIGGSFGAIEGGGLPLFDAFLTQAAELGKGATWASGNERATALYDRLGIPLMGEPTQAEYEEYGGDQYANFDEYYAAWREDFGTQYRLTPEQVKLLAGDMFALARDKKAATAAMVAAGWVEEDHPRDPGGERGGEFIAKGTTAEAERPVMGLGPPGAEEKTRKQNAVPPLVEAQMEADLKDFLDNADLSMRVPEDAMLEILGDGEFYNQHQAGSSRGLQRDPERELEIFGLSDPANLPKYGYLGPDHSGVISYGPMKVVFKDNVKDRTTFTVNDSLVYGGAVVPSPVRDPSYLSANLSQIDEVATAWMPEGMYDSTSGEAQGMNMRYGAEDFTPDGSMWSDAIANEQTSIPYVEAQIYGKLTLDDIDRVEVPPEEDWDLEDPLTGLPQIGDQEAFRRAIDELEKRGIRVSTYATPGDYSGEWA